MTQRKKLIVALLIIGTILLAIVSVVITLSIGNRNNTLETQTGAQTAPIIASCNATTNVCTVPTGVCNPAKVYIHFCDELKRSTEKCISLNPVEIPISPVAQGSSVDLNDYLGSVDCGTVQMYLELENSGVNSLGACGTTIKRFGSACSGATSGSPVSFPASFPTVVTPQPTNNNTNNNQGNGGLQIAEPQFSISTAYAPSCESNGDALLKYTLSITNISSVSGTITKVEEVVDPLLISNAIAPSTISNSGVLSGNKITWTESTAARTYSANQTKTLTYQIRIPKNKLSIFQNGTTSTATVTYDTSNSIGNTNSFVLISKHSCTIETTNTVTQTNLPNTSIAEDYKLLIIGVLFILIAAVVFKLEIGEKFIKSIKLNKRKL